MNTDRKSTTGIPRPVLRTTRSVTGSLPAGSRNASRATSRSRSVDPPAPPSSDQPIQRDVVKRICGEESADLQKQVTDLQKRLEEERETGEELNQLRAELKKVLKNKVTSPTESVAEAVKLLRSDVNAILEQTTSIRHDSTIEMEEKPNISIQEQDDAPQRHLLPSQRGGTSYRDHRSRHSKRELRSSHSNRPTPSGRNRRTMECDSSSSE